MAVNRERHNSWAKLGANARLAELRTEIDEILRVYPDLGHEAGSAGGRSRSGRRRRISAKARAAMSEGMRKYWARRKAQRAPKSQKTV